MRTTAEYNRSTTINAMRDYASDDDNNSDTLLHVNGNMVCLDSY
jgi:hypothetical protein